MRNIFVKQLIKRASKNKDVYFLTADLGYNAFEIFQKKFPDRFINAGVAENNMIGIASGLALLNKEVYVYSISPFLVFRSLEQIRNDICHPHLNVKIIGGGGGFSYGEQGISHNPSEDLSVMRSMPNMSVLTPGTKSEANILINIMFKTKGPNYIRLGKAPSIDYKINKNNYKLGDGIVLEKGNDLSIICCGNIIESASEVAAELRKENISAELINFPCIKPLNEKYIINIIKKNNKLVIIEEHSKIGGLNSAFSELDPVLINFSNPYFSQL